MFKNHRQRLSISVLKSTVFETLTLFETASLLCVFPLGTSTSVACFGTAGGLFDSFLTLIPLHFTPLPTDELQHLFFASGADGFLGSFRRNPKPTFLAVWTAGVRDVFLSLDFPKPNGTSRHEKALEVWLQDGGILWNPAP